MRLLVITQTVDVHDPVLGFFHEWIALLAQKYESVVVLTLKRGMYTLPENVTVYEIQSTSARNGIRRKISNAYRFFLLLRKVHGSYDQVFVHMNQEYLLIAGWFWRLIGKRVYLWRNHYEGSFLTDIASWFCTKVFCTSKHSYTARYAKTVYMPVGVQINRGEEPAVRKSGSVLFLGRVAPSKRPEILLDALTQVKTPFSASIVGSPLPKDEPYLRMLKAKTKALTLDEKVSFLEGVSHAEAMKVFQVHDLFINTSRSGMYDKTLFEAAAAGAIVIAFSDDWHSLAGDAFVAHDAKSLSERIEYWLHASEQEKTEARAQMQVFADTHSLPKLIDALETQMRV